MGAIGTPSGRNMRVDRDQADRGNPRDVSDLLLTRDRFIPAPSLNMLAAAWIQFQVHNWANHRRFSVQERAGPSAPPRAERGCLWIGADRGTGNDATPVGRVRGVRDTPAAGTGYERPDSAALRVGDSADLQLDGFECLPLDETSGLPRTDFGEAWWLGLSVLQTEMTRERPKVCAALRAEYANLSEGRIFQGARLVHWPRS